MTEFERQYKKLNKEQLDAVRSIDGPVLVIAGPGTGKTQLLSTRVAYILNTQDVEAHNILCLTFTESAAYEMRQRLVNIIGQKAYNITISTYHAFGSELIKRFPDYFSDEGDLQAIDELRQYSILSEIIVLLPYSNALKKSGNYINDIKNAISDLKQARLSPKDLVLVAKSNSEFISKASTLVTKHLADVVRMGAACVPNFEKLLRDIEKLNAPSDSRNVSGLQDLCFNELSNALESFDVTAKTSELTAWKNKWLVRDHSGAFTMNGVQTVRKLLALAEIYDKYESTLHHNGQFDYNDMVIRASVGLAENTDLRFTLQEQYQYIHLDEFQDTNAAQLELIKQLTNNPLYEGKPNILAVGDDDQAIYAFQGADYSHMLEFMKLYQDVKLVCLTKNYRSHADVLHVAHGIAGQIEERLHQHTAGLQKLLTAENRSLPKTSKIARHEFKSDVAQFAWVTSEVGRLIKQGVKANEIAIIAPRHRFLEPIVPYLRQASVPVHYEKRENILDDVHIIELMQMSRLVLALNNNENELADSLWPEVLSYEFWHIPVEQIWQLSWKAKDTKSQWIQLMIKDKNFRSPGLFFLALANKAKIETLETMLDFLIGVQDIALDENIRYKSPMYDYFFSAKKRLSDTQTFWSILSNLTVLRQRLRDTAQIDGKPLEINDLLVFADNHRQAKIKVLNTSPYHESGDAVQVMTAYRAKGREFEHVFLLACLDEVWGSKSRTQTTRVPLPPNLSFVSYLGASEDERLRLLFVAITRAKTGLYLTSYQNNFSDRPTLRLKYLNEVEKEDSVISTLLPKQHQLVHREDTRAPQVQELTAYWYSRHSQAKTLAMLDQLLKPTLDKYQMAPTHLNNFVDTIYGGPEQFFITTILRFPKGPTKAGQFGNAIHATLEWTHKQLVKTGHLPNMPEIIKYFNQDLSKRPLSKQDHELLLARGKSCLTAYIKQRADSFKPTDLHEVNFKNQGVLVGNAHLSGKIDKLVVDKKNRTIKIIDFKTGDSFGKWDGSSAKLHKYKQQLYIYKLLVEGSYQFADYKVTGGSLEFVEPDDKGKIVQLDVSFETDEMQKTKQLISAVWLHIKNLDFPDISKYPKTIKGITEFEDYLIDS